MRKKKVKKSVRAYHHGNLKREIANKAMQILKEKGTDEINLRELARSIGVSHTALYRHFKSKNDVIAYLAFIGFTQLCKHLDGAEERKCLKGRASSLISLGESYIQFVIENPIHYQLMFHPSLANKSAFSDLQNAAKKSFSFLLAAMDDGINNGKYRNEDPRGMAVSAWALVHGLSQLIINKQLNHQASELGEKIEELVSKSLNNIETGILKR